MCIICTLSERSCSYPPNSQPEQQRQSPPQSGYSSPGPSTVVPSTPGLYDIPAELSAYRSADADVNFDHMELLIRYDLRSHFPDVDDELIDTALKLHTQSMLQAPYYLQEVLALSARGLAFAEPAKSEHYLSYAVNLQTKAIAMYNHVVTTVKIDNITCVPLMQFSTIIGRHLIVDLLARREADFDTFLHHYLAFVKIQTGIKVITHSAWPHLIDSGLKDLLLWAGAIHTATPVGHECDTLRHIVRNATGIDAPMLNACETVISSLQVGFDLHQATQSRNRRHFFVFAWSVSAPELFTELLAQRRPEALVCVAYWGVLCHLSRDLWQVGSVGSYVINSITQYLGPDWAPFMAYPLSFLA